VIEVERSALGAFEQHRLSAIERVHDLRARVGGDQVETVAERERLLDRDIERTVVLEPHRVQARVGTIDPVVHQLFEALGVPNVGDPNPTAPGFVLVRRPDPATRGADLLGLLLLGRLVQHPVVGHEEVRTLAHADACGQVDPSLGERVVLFEELEEVENDAVAEKAALPFVQHTGRDLVQDELGISDVDGVPRVRPALVAGDDVGVLGEDVDDLPLPLVTPLASDDDGAAALVSHVALPSRAVWMGVYHGDPRGRGA